MPPQRSHFGLSKRELRDAAKLLALGKVAGAKRVTIHGAIFDFPRPQQDLPAAGANVVHDDSNFHQGGAAPCEGAVAGESRPEPALWSSQRCRLV